MSRSVLACFAWLILAGCSLIVSGDPVVTCSSDQGCPPDHRCATARGACVANADACSETSCAADERCDEGTLACVANEPPSADADVRADGGEDVTTVDRTPLLPNIGDACERQSDCTRIQAGKRDVTGICALPELTGFALPNFCTTHCCKSADCPSGFFCEHGPNAGRYCVPFSEQTRLEPNDDFAPGTACALDTDCRTGACRALDPSAPSVKTCIDTCCNDTDCGGSMVCGFAQVDDVNKWLCQAPEPGGVEVLGSCDEVDEVCRNYACFGSAGDWYCSTSCCSNANCLSAGMERCVASSTVANGPRINICTREQRGAAPGVACVNDSDCQSNICVAAQCASTCCRDNDCGNGQRCLADAIEPRPHCAAAE